MKSKALLATFLVLLMIFCTACSAAPIEQDGDATTTTTTTSATTTDATSSASGDQSTTSSKSEASSTTSTTIAPTGSTSANIVVPTTTTTQSSTNKAETTTKPTSATTVVIPMPPPPSTTTTTTKQSASGQSTSTTKTTTTTTTVITTTSTTAANSTPAERPKPLADTQLYGYKQLAAMPRASALLAAYNAITKGVAEMKSEIPLASTGIKTTEIELVYKHYRNDHPEHFWLGGPYSYSYVGSTVQSLTPIASSDENSDSYLFTPAEKAIEQEKWDRAVEGYLSLINSSMSEYERELILHDALVNNCVYNKNGGNFIHNAYGALVSKTAVCDGYARAFSYLMKMAGIECTIAYGSSRGEGHAWNVAKIDGNWYHVDVTWDDPSSNKPSLYHGYLNVTDTVIKEDHTIDLARNPLPTATATAANYHILNGNTMETFDAAAIGLRLKNTKTICIYITGNVQAFLNGFNSTDNIYALAEAAGRYGSISYSVSGRELQITLG